MRSCLPYVREYSGGCRKPWDAKKTATWVHRESNILHYNVGRKESPGRRIQEDVNKIRSSDEPRVVLCNRYFHEGKRKREKWRQAVFDECREHSRYNLDSDTPAHGLILKISVITAWLRHRYDSPFGRISLLNVSCNVSSICLLIAPNSCINRYDLVMVAMTGVFDFHWDSQVSIN